MCKVVRSTCRSLLTGLQGCFSSKKTAPLKQMVARKTSEGVAALTTAGVVTTIGMVKILLDRARDRSLSMTLEMAIGKAVLSPLTGYMLLVASVDTLCKDLLPQDKSLGGRMARNAAGFAVTCIAAPAAGVTLTQGLTVWAVYKVAQQLLTSLDECGTEKTRGRGRAQNQNEFEMQQLNGVSMVPFQGTAASATRKTTTTVVVEEAATASSTVPRAQVAAVLQSPSKQ